MGEMPMPRSSGDRARNRSSSAPTDDAHHRPFHFRPSRVEGLADVDEVRVHPDRIELRSGGKWISIAFLSFAPGREVDSGRVPIGELHFDQSDYAQSHFVFYTTPRIAIYMPADGPTSYPDSCFWRVQEMVGA